MVFQIHTSYSYSTSYSAHLLNEWSKAMQRYKTLMIFLFDRSIVLSLGLQGA